MKLKILSTTKTESGSIEMPEQFYEPLRTDLITKSFLIIQDNSRQTYGADLEAGKKVSAELSRRRKKYRGSYGFGISRVPRKILSRRGTRMSWVGAFAPGTVGGRRAHPPKSSKIWTLKMNKTENRKAIRSAITATINPELVKERGHIAPSDYPFIIDDKIISITKTKELKAILEKLGFKEELIRAKERESKGLLLVTTDTSPKKAFSNIPGFEVVSIDALNTEVLAPGGNPGRLTLFTTSAIKELAETKLYTQT